jgi:hypothetical protein
MQPFPSQNKSRLRCRLVEVVCFSFTLLPLVPAHLQAADAAESAGLLETDAKNWHLLQPLWASPIFYRESVLFIQDGTAAPDARLALNPRHIVQIARADGSQVFKADDYTVDAATGRLTLTPKSRIPNLKADETFHAKVARAAFIARQAIRRAMFCTMKQAGFTSDRWR